MLANKIYAYFEVEFNKLLFLSNYNINYIPY